ELQPDRRRLLLRSGVGWDDGLVGHATVPAGGNSQAGFTLATEHPVIVDDLETETRFSGPDLLTDHGVVSGLSVVIGDLDQPFGVFGAHTRERRTFTEADADFLQAVANVLASAVERDASRRALEAANEELEAHVEDRTRELRDSEARFRTLFENSPVGIFLTDPEGDVLEVNRAFARLLGYAREDVIGRPLAFFVHPGDTAGLTDALQRLTTDGGDRTAEVRFVHRGGSVVHTAAALSTLHGAAGQPQHVVGSALDVTDRKRLETELLEVTEQERRRLGQDLHDGLGQQLTGAAFLAQVLQQKLEAAERNEATDAALLRDLLNEVLADVRDAARLLSPVAVEADGLVDALKELCRRTSETYGVECRVEAEDDVQVMDNRVATHLFRIVQEAVNNALKHADPSEIAMRLWHDDDGGLHVAIHDDGAGISEEAIRSMPGLGLRTMQYRAEAIGARFAVRATDPGTTVEVEL
ncbi:MAG: PAS domain S-box protein, partial [Rhodothermales bacterium]|nr:PAS domain S-box protein [Rhodothermales bacterium]